jgi:hypothetical protein
MILFLFAFFIGVPALLADPAMGLIILLFGVVVLLTGWQGSKKKEEKIEEDQPIMIERIYLSKPRSKY